MMSGRQRNRNGGEYTTNAGGHEQVQIPDPVMAVLEAPAFPRGTVYSANHTP